MKNNKPREALIQLKKANRLEPNKDFIKDYMAQALSQLGESEDAISLLESINPKFRKHFIWRTLGEINYSAGKYSAATSDSLEAVKRQPNNHNYQFLLAKCYEASGENSKAFTGYKKAIELKRNEYGSDFEDAEERFQSLLSKFPDIEEKIATDSPEPDGFITKYLSDKGYGFIKPVDHGRDVFFHVSEVDNPESIAEGEGVSFNVKETPKGLNAINVTVL